MPIQLSIKLYNRGRKSIREGLESSIHISS